MVTLALLILVKRLFLTLLKNCALKKFKETLIETLITIFIC